MLRRTIRWISHDFYCLPYRHNKAIRQRDYVAGERQGTIKLLSQSTTSCETTEGRRSDTFSTFDNIVRVAMGGGCMLLFYRLVVSATMPSKTFSGLTKYLQTAFPVCPIVW